MAVSWGNEPADPISLPLLSLLLGLLLALFAAHAEAAGGPMDSGRSLAGTWRFSLDREDRGLDEHWFQRRLPGRIQLPGALQNQRFGDEITADTRWTGDVGSDRWKQRPEYAPYREPGNIKVPFFLQPERHYVGPAWYQRTIDIPRSWAGRMISLTLERPHWGTHAWLDHRPLGSNTSLSTPHVYELGHQVSPGTHTLTLRVDNRILVEVGDWSHSVSDHTQGNWNGVIGRIALTASDPVWIDDVQVYPDATARRARLQVRGRNSTGDEIAGSLILSGEQPGAGTGSVVQREFRTAQPEFTFDEVIPLPAAARLWDEFQPALCQARVRLQARAGERHFRDERTVRFGLRTLTTAGRQFRLNDRPVFFRGTLECCIFPKTGYPPTDVATWRRVLQVCRAHGLNHLRFHSWCPPEAAFVAGDELGFYFQVECGVWTEPGNGKPIDRWLLEESQRIVRAYGHHPSFMLFTHGNEPHGPKREEYLAKWVDLWKRDGRFLVTSGSAYPQLPENQYHVFYPSRGPHGWLGQDYRRDVAKLDVPVIVHEMGQWCVFPNFDEMRKYTGPLQPKNFEIFRESLAQHGMLGQWRDFLRASGRLQVLCYKEEIEAALRTPGIGGVQLLDLHDFPGQGTALVGVLDPFWESKGYVTSAEFRRFYGPVVPLARLLKRTWTTAETLSCEVEAAQFRPAPIENAITTWTLQSGQGATLSQGAFPPQTLSPGQNLSLGRIRVELAAVAAPVAARLRVAIRDHRGQPVAENDWNVWIYPGTPGDPTPESNEVLIATTLDPAARARLETGGRVLLLPERLPRAHPALTFEPIFWNRYMFNTQHRQTLGLLCSPRHPALAQFPTADHQDWQWQDIVSGAQAMDLDSLPATLRPIIQPIDDWNRNRKLALLFECRIGSGRLLVCSARLNQSPAARQLHASLRHYAASSRFHPATTVSLDDLTRLFDRTGESRLARLGARVISTDSEDTAHGHPAAHAIDGDPDTFWHTRWQPASDPMPHHLTIDLGRPMTVKGITGLPRQDMANGRIAQAEVYLSNDPAAWGRPAGSARWLDTDELQTMRIQPPVRARYLKLTIQAEVNRQPFAALAEVDVQLEEPRP